MTLRRCVRWLGLAAAVLALAGCASAASPSATPTTSPSAAPSPAPALRENFSGWDPSPGYSSVVFRLTWLASSDGHVSGRLILVDVRHRHARRRVFRVAGHAHALKPGTARQRVALRLDHSLAGSRVLYGAVQPLSVALHLPYTLPTELELYGTRGRPNARFRHYLRAVRGPGGYTGWVRRRAEHRAAVHRVDVDGDGRRDLVTVVWTHLTQAGQGTLLATVHYATGAIRSVAVPVQDNESTDAHPRIGWIGRVQLPGIEGHQFVVTWNIGASNRFYSVVGDVNRSLQLISAPPSDYQWGDGGSVGTGIVGRFCQSGALTTYSSREIDHHFRPAHRVRIITNRSVWRSDGWVRIRHTNRNVHGNYASPPHHGHHGLWNCH